MTKTMGQTVYDIFGPNIGHSAASQIAALGAYALTDEYMEELKREAESDAEMARLYIEDHKRTQEKEYLEYANQYSKDEREKLRLIEELMSARSLSKVRSKQKYRVVAKLVGSSDLGMFEADSEQEARKEAAKYIDVSLCWCCSRHVQKLDVAEMSVKIEFPK